MTDQELLDALAAYVAAKTGTLTDNLERYEQVEDIAACLLGAVMCEMCMNKTYQYLKGVA